MRIDIDIEGVDKELQSLSRDLKGTRLSHTIGGSARIKIADHLVGSDAERPNKMGGPRSHFFADAARSTQYFIQADGVYVAIFKTGIRQRFFGGTIRPVKSKYLTIPARAEAYGRRAREFDDLEVLYGRRGAYALAQRAGTSISFVKDKRKSRKGQMRVKRGAQRGGVFFWLVKSVTQTADPSILPTEQQIKEHVVADITKMLAAKGKR